MFVGRTEPGGAPCALFRIASAPRNCARPALRSYRDNPSCNAPLLDGLKSLARARKDSGLAGVALPTPDSDINIGRIDLECAALRPVRSAAIRIVPLPQNGSSTSPPRREQSLIASATSATGLTVGCMANSSSRPARTVLTPA
jgi:hypothetical protein